MLKAMDCGIIVSEFVLQSHYYVHFWVNSLGERYEPPYPPSQGLNSTTIFFCLVGSVCQWSGRPGFNSRSCHTKDFKNGTDTSLLNTQQYKVRIKGKVERSREMSSALLYISMQQLLERVPLAHSRLRLLTLLFFQENSFGIK